MSKTNKKKFQRTSREQIKFYLKFCNKYPDLLAGKYTHKKPKKTLELWEELTRNLNKICGPTRTAAKWRESFSNWRHQIRCRARKGKTDRMTPVDDPLAHGLSDTEELSVNIFETVAVDGVVTAVPKLGHKDKLQVLSADNAASNVSNSSAFEIYSTAHTNTSTESYGCPTLTTFSPYVCDEVKKENDEDVDNEETMHTSPLETANRATRDSIIEDIVIKMFKKQEQQQDQMMDLMRMFYEKQLKLQQENNEQLKTLNKNIIHLTDKVNNFNIALNKNK